MKDNDEGIMQKIAFRLVQKYIAGSTTASVLKTVRSLNNRGMHTTVTLLNDRVSDLVKAKYNANAYSQIMRQIARLHLDSGISLRPTQLGYLVDRSAFMKNIGELADMAKANSIRMWIEAEPLVRNDKLLDAYFKVKRRHDDVGVEIIADSETLSADTDMLRKGDIVRLWYVSKLHNSRSAAKEHQKSIERLCASEAKVTVSSHDVKWLQRMMQNGTGKRNITFEIPLGYGSGKLEKLTKSKGQLSVYVPYGKDWTHYLKNRIGDGRRRGLAIKMLADIDNGEKNGNGKGKSKGAAKAQR